MKRFLFAAVVLLCLGGCNKSISGNGNLITETRTPGHFSSVAINGDATVEIRQGAGMAQQVIVSGYENLVPIYESFVKGDELQLTFQAGYNNIRNNNIHLVIETPDIHALRINGSAAADLHGFANGNAFVTEINGSGHVSLAQSAFDLLTLKVNGSGKIMALDAPARDAEVNVTGSGDIVVKCSHYIKIAVNGSGTIDYYGNPATADINISGSGTVRKR